MLKFKSFKRKTSYLWVASILSTISMETSLGAFPISPDESQVAFNHYVQLDPSVDLGPLSENIYMGQMYDGRHATLSVYSYQHSGDGIFSLQVLDDQGKLFSFSGRRYTLRGSLDETIWQCITKDRVPQIFYFLCDSSQEKLFSIENEKYQKKEGALLKVINALVNQ